MVYDAVLRWASLYGMGVSACAYECEVFPGCVLWSEAWVGIEA